jgi:hypothetical protein
VLVAQARQVLLAQGVAVAMPADALVRRRRKRLLEFRQGDRLVRVEPLSRLRVGKAPDLVRQGLQPHPHALTCFMCENTKYRTKFN